MGGKNTDFLSQEQREILGPIFRSTEPRFCDFNFTCLPAECLSLSKWQWRAACVRTAFSERIAARLPISISLCPCVPVRHCPPSLVFRSGAGEEEAPSVLCVLLGTDITVTPDVSPCFPRPSKRHNTEKRQLSPEARNQSAYTASPRRAVLHTLHGRLGFRFEGLHSALTSCSSQLGLCDQESRISEYCITETGALWTGSTQEPVRRSGPRSRQPVLLPGVLQTQFALMETSSSTGFDLDGLIASTLDDLGQQESGQERPKQQHHPLHHSQLEEHAAHVDHAVAAAKAAVSAATAAALDTRSPLARTEGRDVPKEGEAPADTTADPLSFCLKGLERELQHLRESSNPPPPAVDLTTSLGAGGPPATAGTDDTAGLFSLLHTLTSVLQGIDKDPASSSGTRKEAAPQAASGLAALAAALHNVGCETPPLCTLAEPLQQVLKFYEPWIQEQQQQEAPTVSAEDLQRYQRQVAVYKRIAAPTQSNLQQQPSNLAASRADASSMQQHSCNSEGSTNKDDSTGSNELSEFLGFVGALQSAAAAEGIDLLDPTWLERDATVPLLPALLA
ncbi:hypothetical protein cyc_02096 [Cyclospora cayetanensis]|uniref:Uncharacterized protein n=1 Tax=Cyclospora cayetanensis TaxID=88456 RepID=A0A1D3CWQ2_9EIME|nr:hypothetical protein cyc_02096 [Cyclospora cayetanensis]